MTLDDELAALRNMQKDTKPPLEQASAPLPECYMCKKPCATFKAQFTKPPLKKVYNEYVCTSCYWCHIVEPAKPGDPPR